MTIIDNPDPAMLQLISLKGACKVYAKCGLIPTRGITATKLLKLAAEFTGKKYKRGEHMKAYQDLQALCDYAFDDGSKVDHSSQMEH